MARRVLLFVVFMICLWGGSYLLWEDFTPGWMKYPIFMTAVIIGIPAFMKSVVAVMVNDHRS